jgi:hypothetical protein
MTQREGNEAYDLAGTSLFTSRADLKQPVRQQFEKLAAKGRQERSLWWIEQDGKK